MITVCIYFYRLTSITAKSVVQLVVMQQQQEEKNMPTEVCKLINNYIPRDKQEVLAEYFHHFMTAEKLECNDLFGNIVMKYTFSGPDDMWQNGELMFIYDTKILYRPTTS